MWVVCSCFVHVFVSDHCGVLSWLFQAFLGVCCVWLGGVRYAAWRGVQNVFLGGVRKFGAR